MSDLSPEAHSSRENQVVREEPLLSIANLPRQDRLERLSKVTGNISIVRELFDLSGKPSGFLKEILKELPLFDPESSEHLVDALENKGALNHHSLEEALQQAFFKPNEAKFSFQLAVDGDVPSMEQLEVFSWLSLVEAINLDFSESYDCGVIFGGTLAAIDARTRNLLNQPAELKSIALLGGERKVIQDKETGVHLEKVIGARYFQELAEKGLLPKTEFELMTSVWESYCRRNDYLRDIPVIEVDSQLRLGKIKEAPGTPDTVVDLHNTLVSGYQIPGLEALPTSFLLSSSQPHTVGQGLDFISSMLILNYPANMHVDAVGYANSGQPALKLYATEVAKLVHGLYLLSY